MRIVAATFFCFFFCLNAGAQSWVPATGSFSQSVSFMIEDTLQNVLYILGQFGYHDEDHVGGFCSFDGQNVVGYGCGFDCSLPYWELISGAGAATIYRDTLYISRDASETYDTLTNDVPGTRGLAKFYGGEWFPVSNLPYQNTVLGMGVINNELYMAGYDTAAIVGIANYGGVLYNGNSWAGWQLPEIGSSGHYIGEVVQFEDKIYIAGNFGGSDCFADISYWEGNSWECLSTGIADASWCVIYDMTVFQDELYIGGVFERSAGNPGEGIMKWNGTEWSDVGYGLTNGEVHDMEVHNGELYVCGHFDEIGNIPADNFAKWDGHRWCALDAHFGNNYNRNLAFYNDTLYAVATTDSCANCLFKWNGTVDTCSVDFNAVIEYQNSSKFSLYPNPVRESATIESDIRMLSVEIFDLTGRKIYTTRGNSTKQLINIETLAKGCYYALVRFENGSKFTRKFIKE
jgi:hypothetical protein